MHTTDLPADALAKVGLPPSPDERFRELAAILAGGLLRLCSRRQLGVTSDMSSEPACAEAPAGRHAVPKESAEAAQKPLGLTAPPGPDRPAG